MSADTRSRLGAGLLSLVSAVASAGLVWSLLTLVSLAAQAQDGAPIVALPEAVDPLASVSADEIGAALEEAGLGGWKGTAVRWAFAILALWALVEALRWTVPGFERGQFDEHGEPVRLAPRQRLILLGLTMAGGQFAAFGGIINPPWNLPVATAFAGIIAGASSAVFNEAIAKRIMKLAQDRLGIEPPRMKKKRAAIATMTTGQFRVARAEEQGGAEPPAA